MLAPRILGATLKQSGRRLASSKCLPRSTYNDLPSPCGNWKTHYDANQRKYNAQLIIGVSTLVGTVLFGTASGLIDLNFYPPERPADIKSYK